jgi:hypothetical protein
MLTQKMCFPAESRHLSTDTFVHITVYLSGIALFVVCTSRDISPYLTVEERLAAAQHMVAPAPRDTVPQY